MKTAITMVSESTPMREVIDNGQVLSRDKPLYILDSHNTHLYENDIVVYNGVCFVIYWTQTAWMLKDANDHPIRIDANRMLEVFQACTQIGNVHENLELLEPPSQLDIQTDLWPVIPPNHDYDEWASMYQVSIDNRWDSANRFAQQAADARNREQDMTDGTI